MKVPNEEIKQLIKEHFSYDPNTGELKYKILPHSKKTTTRLGSIIKDKNTFYHKIMFKNTHYMVHRIAWFLHYDRWPEKEIDHIDGNGLNNKINNLREVSQRRNALNRIYHRNGRLGGCYFDKQRNKWQAQISINGKSTYLGSFNTEQEAHQKYLQAREEIEK